MMTIRFALSVRNAGNSTQQKYNIILGFMINAGENNTHNLQH